MQLHFDDCPYRCNKRGEVFDRQLGKFVPCTYCQEKRKVLVAEGTSDEEGTTLQEALGFNDPYLSSYFDFEGLLPEFEKKMLLASSVTSVRKAVDHLRGLLSAGTLPDSSYCFGLARKGSVDRFAFPLLALAYTGGIAKGKFVSSRVYHSLYLKDKDLSDYYDMDLLFVLVTSGASYNELMTSRGLMEARAVEGKPTIFVTNGDIDDCLLLLGSVSDPSLYLATPYFLERQKTAASHSYASDNLRGGMPTVEASPGLGISLADLEEL